MFARLARFRALVARFPRPALMIVAVAAIATYLILGIIHLRYPFELEWMEGGMVDEVRRVLAGQKIYVKPTLDFVPYLYAPLYFYVSAAFAKVFGVGFFSLRLVSYLSSIGAGVLIAMFVHRETEEDDEDGARVGDRRFAALLAVGLFAATYRESSAFMDIARVDSLFVFLLLGALYLLRFGKDLYAHAGAALLFTLAFLTKQSALIVFAPVALYALIAHRRRAVVFVFGSLALMGVSFLVFNWVHEGWFYYFVFWLPRQHPLVPRMRYDFWIEDLFAPLCVACLSTLLYLFVPSRRSPRLFYAFAAAGMLGTSWAGRLHAGGWPNVIIPGFAMLSVLFGLGVYTALSLAREAPDKTRRGLEAFVLAAAGVQFVCVVYDPRPLVPTQQDREAGEALVRTIAAQPGEVFMPAHGYLSSLAGKRTFAQEMAMSAILGIDGGPPGYALKAEIVRALAEKRFGAVLTDTEFMRREIEQNYARKGDVFRDRSVFYPITGMRTRPRSLYLRR